MGDQGDHFCKGLHVLLVEDEAVIAMLTESMLAEMGCDDVAIAGSVAQALSAIDSRPPDLAVLDVNLRGQMVLPVAEKLAAAGIPFTFATGYGASEVTTTRRRAASSNGKSASSLTSRAITARLRSFGS